MIRQLPEQPLNPLERSLVSLFRAMDWRARDLIFRLAESQVARLAPPTSAVILQFKGTAVKRKRGRPAKKGVSNA